ncbi:MAG: hypothetical protein V3U86_11205 [Acidobacteriota bacterium]
MRFSRLNDPTLFADDSSRPRKRSRRGLHTRLLPGAPSALGALGVMCLFVLLAPSEVSSSQASFLAAWLGPLVLLVAAAVLGAVACLSGIRHLWIGDMPVRGVLSIALAACPIWLSASLIVLRTFFSSS